MFQRLMSALASVMTTRRTAVEVRGRWYDVTLQQDGAGIKVRSPDVPGWESVAATEQEALEAALPPLHAVPLGWPTSYGRTQDAGGQWVVTVCGVPTMMPRWTTEEEARLDAWERHRQDPDPIVSPRR